MDRVILHIDMNNFYASVECLYDPQFWDVPMAVGGDKKNRHGVILAKNNLAKKMGVQTGEPLWQAKQKCPDLVFAKPHFDRYEQFSKKAKEIYSQYTDQVESFGLDECWLDVTGSTRLFGSGMEIANEIRERIKEELHLTVSIGVSFNKIFAKLGSDFKKPDAVTEFSKENFKNFVWNLPASDLLYVGKSTGNILRKYGINTIGDIANTDEKFLKKLLGKAGTTLWIYANGLDESPVTKIGEEQEIKSIGNSITAKKDLKSDEDVKIILYLLSEKVAERLRDHEFSAMGLGITLRRTDLHSYSHQCVLDFPISDSDSVFKHAFRLYKNSHDGRPLRSISIKTFSLVRTDETQVSLFSEEKVSQKRVKLESTIDDLRKRFGENTLQRGILYKDKDLSNMDNDKHKNPWEKF